MPGALAERSISGVCRTPLRQAKAEQTTGSGEAQAPLSVFLPWGRYVGLRLANRIGLALGFLKAPPRRRRSQPVSQIDSLAWQWMEN